MSASFEIVYMDMMKMAVLWNRMMVRGKLYGCIIHGILGRIIRNLLR